MKNIVMLSAVLLLCAGPGRAFASADNSDATNNFYDNTELSPLTMQKLEITGEVAKPGPVDFSKLPLHSVMVKETTLERDGKTKFTGAYRYDGYSLFDILNNSVPEKRNRIEFPQLIDLYVEVENFSGEKAVFSWGELYYSDDLHKVIIAASVSRIVPTKTRDLWPLPMRSKLVAAGDLITERNIEEPVKITVKSYPRSFTVQKGMSPMYSASLSVYSGSEKKEELTGLPVGLSTRTYETVFYGRGSGIHSTTPFTGVLLKELLQQYYPLTRENLRTGMLCVTAKDGYRAAVSYSELFNRSDQREFLLVKTAPDADGGLFSLFPAPDFFSDRAVRSVTGIHFDDR